jgi:hypothetical protein
MIGSVLLKPSVSIAPALFPPNALAFCAYYLLPPPLWAVNLLATTIWDLLIISGVTHMVAGTQPTIEYVLIVSWSSALICMGTALAVRMLGLETRARNDDPIAVPLLLLALAVGSIPGDLLATWIHARAAHGPIKAEDVSVRMLSALLTIVTISPLFLAVLRRVEGTELPLARATEIAGIGTSFAMLFGFYYIAPWPLDRFLELMLLAGPMLWLRAISAFGLARRMAGRHSVLSGISLDCVRRNNAHQQHGAETTAVAGGLAAEAGDAAGLRKGPR